MITAQAQKQKCNVIEKHEPSTDSPFVYPFYFLGRRYVLMNHHMHLHLKKSVADHGPLWCTFLFVFEDWNGDLDSYFHGTQNIAGQVGYKISLYANVP